MPASKLSPELHKRIIQFVGDRPSNCFQLCLVSKAFQRDAEPLLYQYLPLFTPQAALSACKTIVDSDRHGSLVRVFYFCVEWGNRSRPPPLPRTFWVLVQGALKRMPNLEKLFIYDPGFMNTWIFDAPDFPFQLSELKIRFPWDSNLARFLQSQPKLVFLNPMAKVSIDGDIEAIHLPNLRILDSSICLAQHIHAPSITNAQFNHLPQEPERVLPILRRLPPTLRGLNLSDLPEDLSSPALEIVSRICPNLRHLGTLFLPITNVRVTVLPTPSLHLAH
ncbi:hypothetical protein EST38_g10438 [Candolleomyces aberdarensis]|uniref:F-box domain-containing protein n=1 Tax=Candolleomyces aberdarensis TaxID=2316362 RepID=A0A4Q2D7D7_9AGAR|nr:hypothetical protein EST38_g10438 [Candolleomyces aberdarensis]